MNEKTKEDILKECREETIDHTYISTDSTELILVFKSGKQLAVTVQGDDMSHLILE